MKHQTYYAVKIKDRLALGQGDGPALFYYLSKARKFRDELIPHIGIKGKVVRVSVEWEHSEALKALKGEA